MRLRLPFNHLVQKEPLADLTAVVLLSDGGSRLVDRFAQSTLEVARARGVFSEALHYLLCRRRA
jgi:hypothetical protein